MSRRRLERGYWNGRQVAVTNKEHDRLYVRRPERDNRYYIRFGVTMRMDWPWPTSFDLEHRLPRKTLKALWKDFNGHPTIGSPTPSSQLTRFPVVIHNGRKPR